MPWRPLPQIAFGIVKCPFQPTEAADLPLELGDELYIIEEGGTNREWCRGYLVAPPSLIAGLTSVKGQALEARVFSGIFPRNCVEIKEYLGTTETSEAQEHGRSRAASESRQSVSEKRQEAALQNGAPIPEQEDKSADAKKALGKHDSQISQRTVTANGKSPISPTFPVIDPDGKRVRPPAPVPMLKIGDESANSAVEPLIDEIASCLREWHSTNLHELLLSRQYSTLGNLSRLFNQLEISRRQMLHGVLTEQELESLRERTVWDLVRGNQMLNNDVVVRDPKLKGRLLHENDDPIQISKLQSMMSLLGEPPKPAQESFNLHHLLLETRDLENTRTDSPKAVLYLASRQSDGPLVQLSEAFMMELPHPDHLQRANTFGRLRTVFTNLTSTDIGSVSGSDTKLYLVIKIQVNHVPQPPSRLPSRAGTSAKDASRDSVSTNPSGSVGGKTGRRSILFGGKGNSSQRNRLTKMEDISESADEGSSSPKTQPSDKPASGSGRNEPNIYVKRFVGAGILPLDDVLSEESEADHSVSIWSPLESKAAAAESDSSSWPDLLDEILTSPVKRWTKLSGLSHLNLHFQSFACPDPETLIKKTPTVLHSIIQTPKIGFSGAPRKPRSDIYITVSEANIPPAASFLHPERGAVELPQAADMRNLQLTLEVRKDTGERIARCIFPSSESAGQTAWRSTAIKRGEKWDQTFRLAIPTEDVSTSHVIMSIAEFQEFPFALAWVPLWSNGAFVQDGEHYPNLHLYDQTTSHTESGRGAYLDLDWDSKTGGLSKASSLAGPVATVKLATYLCSTHFSQDKVLLRILNWREEPDDQVLALLRQLVFVPEIEIVKLLNDVFDALFGILVNHAGNEEFEDLTFAAIVTVLAIVHDRRFGLDPVVNEYAETRFDFPAAVPCLIQSYLRLITAPAEYHNSRQLRATFKVGKQIMKFIIMARKQQIKKETYIGITNSQTTFNMDLKGIFLGFEQQMREESAAHVGSKTLIVQHMHTWLPELAPCFTQDQILKAAASFLESCSFVQGKLILHKLVLIYNVLKIAIANPSDYLPKFKERVIDWIDPYWGDSDEVTEQYREQVRLCCSVVSLFEGQYGPLCIRLLDTFGRTFRSILSSERPTGQSLSLLFPSSYPFPSRPFKGPRNFDENLVELVALKATFTPEEIIQHFDFSQPDILELLECNLGLNNALITGEVFPASWLTLHAYHHRAVLERLVILRELLLSSAVPSPDDADQFPTELWRKYFMSLMTLVRSPSLSLETFAEQKRRAVWKICGDIRERGAELLLQVWNDLGWDTDDDEKKRFGLEKLGGYQVQYVPTLVAPIMELCLSVHEGLRRAAIEVLRAMIVSEWSLNEDLTVVQTEIIDCLDILFKTKGFGESNQQRMFINELSDIFEPLKDTPDSALWNAIQDLLETVDQLLDLLFAVHAPEQNELSHIMHTLRLMEFLKRVKKQDTFISYIHKLSAAEQEAGNLKEAGLALRLHADIYSWDTEEILDPLPSPEFPKQTAFERREALFFEMIKFYEEARAWEQALACYKELAEQYEENVYDFAKLARAQRSTAKIYEQIGRGRIDTPRFFRVVYHGHGFSAALRDKTFIFECPSTERLAGFIDQLQQQYPTAHVSSREETETIEGQYIQVTAVTPHRNLDHAIWQRQKVPHSTKEFLASTGTREFSVITRRHSDKSMYKDQSVEKMVYTTASTFPTILRRSEVVAEEPQTLDPLDTALERTLRKIAELAVFNQRAENGDEANMQSLADAIRNAVDPSSHSSVAQYREIIPARPSPSDDEEDAKPTLTPHEQALHVALVDYASCLRQSLSRLAGPAHHQEQIILSRQFHTVFAPELAIIAPVQTATQYANVSTNSFGELIPGEPRSAPPVPTSAGQTITTVTAGRRQSRLGSMFKRSTIAAPLEKNYAQYPSEQSLVHSGTNGQVVHPHHAGGGRPTHILSPTDDSRSFSTASRHSEAPSRGVSIDSIDDNANLPMPKLVEGTRQARDQRSAPASRDARSLSNAPPPKSRRGTNASEKQRPASSKKDAHSFETRERKRERQRDLDKPLPAAVTALSRSGSKKQGSIRKRLSTLGLGRKPSRGIMLEGGQERVKEEE